MTRKICFLTYCPSGGGAATFIRLGLIYLASKAQVTLVDELPEQIMQSVSSSVSQKITVLKVPIWTNPSLAKKQFWHYLESAQPDWIVIDNPVLLLPYRQILHRASRQLGVRTHFTIHSGVLTSTFRRELACLTSSFALLSVNRITSVSEYTRRHWYSKYPWTRFKAIEVIHNGVLLPNVSSRSSKAPWHIGYVGRLEHEKDPLLFCEVARLAKRQKIKANFHVFGSGSLAEKLEANFGNMVTFHGICRDLEKIYSLLDILLVTSPVENCPYVVLEAKSFGIPTIAAAVGGLPEIITNGIDGILCRRRNAQSFLNAIEQISCHYQEFSENCFEKRSQFSLETHGRQMWEPLLQKKSR